MDTTDPEIVFDADGVCNHCHRFDMLVATRVIAADRREAELAALLDEIRAAGRRADYDCVIGVSGGVDSTYVAYLCKQWGLRPLAVHLDNGWNSELAVSNIEKTLSRLDIDLHTHVIDWPEFRDLQLAFLHASTPDAEIPSDHAIFALLYRQAAKFGIRHVLLGTNVVTEAVLPELWGYGYYDRRYVHAVHKQFGSIPLRSYPDLSLARLAYAVLVKRIKAISILNYIDYRKDVAMETIQSQLDWVYYGGKHYESIYTRFFQAYILPRKFNIDKRKAHLSALVLSRQMSRDHAWQLLAEPLYPTPRAEAEDREYVIKKLGLSVAAFDAIMRAPTKTYRDYPNSAGVMAAAKRWRQRLAG
jgi:N-acetyl sugar amidotransferase